MYCVVTLFHMSLTVATMFLCCYTCYTYIVHELSSIIVTRVLIVPQKGYSTTAARIPVVALVVYGPMYVACPGYPR